MTTPVSLKIIKEFWVHLCINKRIKRTTLQNASNRDKQTEQTPPLMSFLLSALGLMMLFEGIPYFCFPARVKDFARKLPELDDSTLRIIGFLLMVLGLVVVYIGRRVISNG